MQTKKVFMMIDSNIDDPTETSEKINYDEIKKFFMEFKYKRGMDFNSPNKKYFTTNFSLKDFENKIGRASCRERV